MDKFISVCETIGQIIAGIIISIYFCKSYLDKHFKSNIAKKIPKQNAIDIAIIDELEKCKELLNADRVQVYEFHNGEHYANYRSALKMSCTYEVVKFNSPALRDKAKAIPLTCMPEFVRAITSNGNIICKDLEEYKKTMPSTYNFSLPLGIKAFHSVAIKNKNKEVIGYISAQWDSTDNVVIDEESMTRFAWYVEEQLNSINL